jgi:hypothetical protein
MRARSLVIGGLAAGGSAAVLLGRKIVGGDGAGAHKPDRWHVVTVHRRPDEVVPDGRLPDPLAELGDQIEVQVRPAPADRGTELAARLRAPVPSGLSGAAARISGDDPRQELRMALRHAKMLLETGEILNPDKPPTTRRTPTNLPLELTIQRARREGRL